MQQSLIAGRVVLLVLLVAVVHIAGFSGIRLRVASSPSFWKASRALQLPYRGRSTALFVRSRRIQQWQHATNRQINQISSNRISQWRRRHRHVQNIQNLRFLQLRLLSSLEMSPDDGTVNSPTDGQQLPQLESLQVAGVAVSCTGFWVILQVSTSQSPRLSTTQEWQPSRTSSFLPIQITNGTMDATTATSPQALTVLQLLAGVDMAGAILPPTLLSEIVVRTCESNDFADSSDTDASIRRKIVENVRVSVRTAFHANNITAVPQQTQNYAYSDQNPWIRSRVRLPTCKLHQVLVRFLQDEATTNDVAEKRQELQFILDCTVQGYGRLSVPILQETVLRRMFSALSDENSDWPTFTPAYAALSVALRYRAPLSLVQAAVVNEQSGFLSENELLQQFPNYRGVSDALQPADRSASNIAKSFEIHSLQAALTLARRRGDDTAAAKIRAAIDTLDEKSFQDIPVQAESDTSSMQ
jgi:hypothetical protein